MAYFPAVVTTGYQVVDMFGPNQIGPNTGATREPNTGSGNVPNGTLLIGPTRNVSGTWTATQVLGGAGAEPMAFTVDYYDPILGWVDSTMAKVLIPASGSGNGTFSTPQLPAQALGSRVHPHLAGMSTATATGGLLVVTSVSS